MFKKICLVLALSLISITSISAQVSSSTARRLVRFSGAPTNPAEGDVYYNLTSHLAFYYDGTTFQQMSGGGGGSGLAADGSVVGATSQIQVFTNGVSVSGVAATTNLFTLFGTQPVATSAFGSTGAGVNIVLPNGGDTSTSTANRFAGAGGGFIINEGFGGTITGTGNSTTHGGVGGGFILVLGNGGDATGATGSSKGGNAGSIFFTGGQGGAALTHAGVSGNGSSFSFLGGPGGTNNVSGGTAGNGGNVVFDTGVAGTATAGATTGVNGSITLGAANALAINLGNSATTTTIIGNVTISTSNSTGQCTLDGSVTATCTHTVPSSCIPICIYIIQALHHTP